MNEFKTSIPQFYDYVLFKKHLERKEINSAFHYMSNLFWYLENLSRRSRYDKLVRESKHC